MVEVERTEQKTKDLAVNKRDRFVEGEPKSISDEQAIEHTSSPCPNMPDQAQRPNAPSAKRRMAAPNHGSFKSQIPEKPELQPNEQAWPNTKDHDQTMRQAAGQPSDKTDKKSDSHEKGGDDSEHEHLPATADLVTVEEAVTLFKDAGLPRHMRTIQKYCAKKNGRALTCYQIPTENGIRYMIERLSIERFIADAAQQAPTGALKDHDQVSLHDQADHINDHKNQPETTSQPSTNVFVDLPVYEHPYVKRLETEIEHHQQRYDHLQGRFEQAMDTANKRLIELQQAAAIAQSETLGKFMLESKRMDHSVEAESPTVDK